MIFRPVKPASPIGPPITKSPHGLIWHTVFASKYFGGIVVFITFSVISWRKFSKVIFSLCWVETTIVWTLVGLQAPLSNTYSHVTCVLVSGLAHQRVPSLRRSAIFLLRAWARTTVRGMHSSVSSVA